MCWEERVTTGKYHILGCNMYTFQLVKKKNQSQWCNLFSSEVISKAASHTAEDRNYVIYIVYFRKKYIYLVLLKDVSKNPASLVLKRSCTFPWVAWSRCLISVNTEVSKLFFSFFGAFLRQEGFCGRRGAELLLRFAGAFSPRLIWV